MDIVNLCLWEIKENVLLNEVWRSKEGAESLYFSARAALRNSGGSNGKENAGNSGIIGIDDGENFANLQHFNPEHLASYLFLMSCLQRNYNK